jgi:hypothetical protein
LAPIGAARNTFGMTTAAAPDRRRNRSDDPLVALHYQLSQTRQEGSLEAIVVADDSGVVVAGAGAWVVCEDLAAYAPHHASGGWAEPDVKSPPRLAEMRSQVDVQAVAVEGQTVLLCARGGRGRSGALDRAARGVARILTAA